MTKAEAKQFLRICKDSNIIKFNPYLKSNGISHSAISKFILYDQYDDFVGMNKLEMLCSDLYNTCGCIVDMYREIVLHENIE